MEILSFNIIKKHLCCCSVQRSDMADRRTDRLRKASVGQTVSPTALDKDKLSGGDLTSHLCPRYVAPRVDPYIMHK